MPEAAQPEHQPIEPNFIYNLPSGRLYLANFQLLRGYCILRSEPVVPSINDLDEPQRSQFLKDMVLVGDAIQAATGAYRMNYLVAGNFDPVLHAHIVPRFLSEPDENRKDLPWLYPEFEDSATRFDYARDCALMREIAAAVAARLTRTR